MATSPKLDAKIPQGEIDQKWTKYRSTVHLVNPANKRSLEIYYSRLRSCRCIGSSFFSRDGI